MARGSVGAHGLVRVSTQAADGGGDAAVEREDENEKQLHDLSWGELGGGNTEEYKLGRR